MVISSILIDLNITLFISQKDIFTNWLAISGSYYLPNKLIFKVVTVNLLNRVIIKTIYTPAVRYLKLVNTSKRLESNQPVIMMVLVKMIIIKTMKIKMMRKNSI